MSTFRVPPPAAPRPPRPSQRGSVLITALIFASIIAISLASYIQLALNSLKLADRSFYQNAALNLAEVGIERALLCYNQLDNVSTAADAWASPWSIQSDNSVRAKYLDIEIGPGVTGDVRVYCRHYAPGTGLVPVIVSQAIVKFPVRPNGERPPSLVKSMEVTLRKRSLFANGMVARDSMVWNGGNASADSWNSDHDNNSATAPVAYGSASGPARANATVGTPSSANGALDFGGGTIRGRVMNAGGTISKSSGAILSSTTTGTTWDASLVSSDFSATFPAVEVPNPPTLNKNAVNASTPINVPSTLPRSGDLAYNGVYYYDFGSGWTLAAGGAASNVLTINGPVVFLATAHSGSNVIDLSGNASIAVSSSGRLKVYTNGNIEAAGNGLINSNVSPETLQIYGTNPTTGAQTVRFVGNGTSKAAIYAPNGTFQLRGNGSLHGAVVAATVNLNGNASFHYDEALGNMTSGNPFGIVKWRELVSADDRLTYSTQLDF